MKQKTQSLLEKALNLDFLTGEELAILYCEASLGELMESAHTLREKLTRPGVVSWMVDRNINISNRCFCGCSFCNFHVKPGQEGVYVTTIEQYKQKIDRLYELGGNQILLQGGLDPWVGLDFYVNLFRQLKSLYPTLKLHALGPAEIHFLAKKSKLSIEQTLKSLVEAGMESLPGAGAEILVDRVRNIVSPNKCTTQEWLDVMAVAHKMNLVTSATMMFGHVETMEERMEHLVKIRELQANRPEGTHGFKAFIAWPFQKSGTVLEQENTDIKPVGASEYIRMVALSRLALVNIPNIQASWLTVGKDVAQVCLQAGANDLGSIMIEENVVSSAGAHYSMNEQQMVGAIIEAGFTPLKRNQDYTQFCC
jgi:cyclic dehypoxanthinyl futalosine synthase